MRTANRWLRRMAVGAAVGGLLLTGCGGNGGTSDGETTESGTGSASGTETAEGTEGETSTDGGGELEEGSPVTLSVVSSFPRDAGEHDGFWAFVERLEQNAPWITIDYRGGPDVMDPLQLVESLQSGAIDMATLPDAYYVQQAPIAELLKFTPYLPGEERENGLFDIYQQWHREALNAHYLGKVFAGVPYQVFTVDALEEPDLSGRTIRASSGQAAMIQGLGGEVVNIPSSEVFTALERGTVDGFGWASVGVSGNGWQDVVGYQIEPRFGEATIPVLLNAETWDGLEPATQEALTQTMIEMEPEIVDLYRQLAEEEQQAYLDAGVEPVTFTGEDAQLILETNYTDGFDLVGYDQIVEQFPIAEEMRAMYEEGYGENFEDAVPGPKYFGTDATGSDTPDGEGSES
jgi:TRAP-type C4-dicarboxylate transport system substrate-binding protein